MSSALAQSPPLAKSGCQSQCGGVTIPYPFGIGPNCYLDEWFSISCNDTYNPSKPFLNSSKLEVLDVSIELGTVRVNYPAMSTCGDMSNAYVMGLEGGPFVFSQSNNRFTAVGCNNLALMTMVNGSAIGGCLSFCRSGLTASSSSSTCNGIDCCQTTIPSDLQVFNTTIESVETGERTEGCKYAFLVDRQWFENEGLRKASDIQNMDSLPVVLEWRIDRRTYDMTRLQRINQ
ncbi:hypothetical protein C1H46_037313 [Malus baccata]|uniref:Wall-associated receptor kinase galacturonan-binding domain-containing protein n=1 Tax=Malus baccata TaxID=106549 RepID=A0A540KSN1_MALBA|nr:hypothetical protein C1H46_037313 [Malus baccata]